MAQESGHVVLGNLARHRFTLNGDIGRHRKRFGCCRGQLRKKQAHFVVKEGASQQHAGPLKSGDKPFISEVEECSFGVFHLALNRWGEKAFLDEQP